MTAPRRVFWNRFAGERLPKNTILITRPSRYGNPFRVGHTTPANLAFGEPVRVRDRAHAVELFRLKVDTDRELAALAADLAGKDVACACPVDEPCHGDVWLELPARVVSRG